MAGLRCAYIVVCLYVCEYIPTHIVLGKRIFLRTWYIVLGTRRRVRAGGEADPPGQMGRAGEQLARSVVL